MKLFEVKKGAEGFVLYGNRCVPSVIRKTVLFEREELVVDQVILHNNPDWTYEEGHANGAKIKDLAVRGYSVFQRVNDNGTAFTFATRYVTVM